MKIEELWWSLSAVVAYLLYHNKNSYDSRKGYYGEVGSLRHFITNN